MARKDVVPGHDYVKESGEYLDEPVSARDSLSAADAIVDAAVNEVEELTAELRRAKKAERDARAARARRAGLLR